MSSLGSGLEKELSILVKFFCEADVGKMFSFKKKQWIENLLHQKSKSFKLNER